MSQVFFQPQRVINEINNIVQNFTWDISTSKIAQKTLMQNIENGGLILCNFETKMKALKLSWVKYMSTEHASTWKMLPSTFLTVITLINILE